MNILRAAVIMASTSSEKSSKESLSMPSSQTRGMLAACSIGWENIKVERKHIRMGRSDDDTFDNLCHSFEVCVNGI